MKYVYLVTLAQPNFLSSRTDFYSIEFTTPKRISTAKDLEDLLPLARIHLRNDLIERAKAGGYSITAFAIPENAYDQVGIIAFSLLRREK